MDPELMQSAVIDCRDAGERLDQFLQRQMEDHSRSFLQKLIKEGSCLVNGKQVKSGYMLRAGDLVEWEVPVPKTLEILPEAIPLDILYEDDDLLVVNKPKGMVVHPAPGHTEGTLVNALLYHCEGRLSGINGVLRPGIVHRIDRDTTGSLIVCKNDRSHNSIAAQLAEHSIRRRYLALVRGGFRDDNGRIDAPIGRHPIDRKKMCVSRSGGKNAVTNYRVLERFPSCTLIECALETGRTHQIRVHMASIGHPLLGDEVYGDGYCPFPGVKLEGQVLHAKTIGFIHPVTGAYLEFNAPLPDYFRDLLKRLGSRFVSSVGESPSSTSDGSVIDI